MSFEEIRCEYQRFAEMQVKDISPLYYECCLAICASESALRFINSLPKPKQQPNLVLAATRHLFGIPQNGGHFVRLIEQYAEVIRKVILVHDTQTNEPARCAILLPALAQLRGPLAILEVGASAGLCLLPDHWGYDYGSQTIAPSKTGKNPVPIFPCAANAQTPLPSQCPPIAWRAGLDLNPLDVLNLEDMTWLETLVWPEQADRAARLKMAIKVAQEFPPKIVKGDLITDLDAIAKTAPKDATLVIFHSAVLTYVNPADRTKFVAKVKELNATWVSNEAPSVFPDIADKVKTPAPAGKFVLAIDANPVAFTFPHGQSIEWL